MQKLTGSGAATNAGIDYQQRASAWFLMGLLLDVELPIAIEELRGKKVTEVSFETANPIDDLKISFNNNLHLFAQIKRSLSFSSSPESDFYKTLNQFVRQFIVNPEHCFVLITSPSASLRITETWKKILESIRLNDVGFEQNLLSKLEKETFDEYISILRIIYKELTEKDLPDEVFVQISKRVYVSKLDIEADAPHEQSAIMMLGQKCNANPYLVWDALVVSCLHMAKSRLSINKEGCLLRFGKYLRIENSDVIQNNEDVFKLIIKDNISCGKEVLLVSGEKFGQDFVVFELFRFEDDCSKRVRFEPPDKHFFSNGDEVQVIFRSSTFAGLERYVNSNESLYKDKNTVIIPANDIDGVDDTPCAKAYQDYCNDLLAKNKGIHLCIHCEKPVTSPEGILIEIDDLRTPSAIGVSHDECRRPIDRVLGIVKNEFFSEYPFLKNFNAPVWAELIVNGQLVFRQLNSGMFGKTNIYRAIWTPDDQQDAESDYCIKINLSDGSFEYVISRAKVERFSKIKAEEQAKKLSMGFDASKKVNDPWCYTSKNKIFGVRSILMKSKDIDERCVECVSAETVRYSKSIGALYDKAGGFYTPVCLLVDKESEEPVSIHGLIVLITQPLKLNHFLENWREAEVNVFSDYELRIIKGDKDFDIKARQFTDLGYAFVADPILDADKNIISGVIILSVEQAKSGQ